VVDEDEDPEEFADLITTAEATEQAYGSLLDVDLGEVGWTRMCCGCSTTSRRTRYSETSRSLAPYPLTIL
jgi:hypothetical protein